MGERHHIYLVNLWQRQVEKQRTGMDFAKTFGQRRPEEDMLSEGRISHLICTAIDDQPAVR